MSAKLRKSSRNWHTSLRLLQTLALQNLPSVPPAPPVAAVIPPTSWEPLTPKTAAAIGSDAAIASSEEK